MLRKRNGHSRSSSWIGIQTKAQFILKAKNEDIYLDKETTFFYRPPTPFIIPPETFIRFEIAFNTSQMLETLSYHDYESEKYFDLNKIYLVHCSGSFSWEFTFHLEKGGSATYEFGLEDKVEKVTIDLKEGSILIDHGNKLKKETKKEAPVGKPLQEKIPISKGSFSADYEMNIKGQIIKGKIFLKDHIYRYDMIPEGAKESKVKDEIKTQLGKVTVETSVKIENVSYIIDQKSGQALIIIHDEKVYGEAPRDATDIYNPIEAHYSMRELYTLLDKGEEKIGDLACEKRELRMDNQLIQTAWIAKKYLFPIKIVNYSLFLSFFKI